MFRHMPSVYCSGPDQPGGVTSGQRPGPSFFENCTAMPLDRMLSSVIVVVIGQLARSRGELRITACPMSMPSGPNDGGGVGGGGVGAGGVGGGEFGGAGGAGST